MKCFVLFVLLGLTGSLASAQSKTAADTTVFGFHLGEKLSLPECTHLKKSTLYLYDKVTCFERFSPREQRKDKWNSPIVNESITIVFPFGQQPPLLSGTRISGQMVDGSLESIGFNTAGLSAQERTLSGLKEKYGAPSKVLDETKQNAFGAKFDSPVAIWGFENLTVIYQATTDTITSGMVNIDTTRGSEFRAASLKASHAGPKL